MATSKSSSKVSNRPPPPKAARSLFLPISGVMIAGALAVSVPALTRAANEPPPAEPEPTTVMMPLESTPEGATASVGGEECTTPCELEVSLDDEVEIRFSLEGHREANESVTPALEMEAVSTELDALPTVLAIAAPEGATVFMNDAEVDDPSAIALSTAPDEAIAVRVEQRGFTTFEASIAPDAFEDEDERRFHELSVALEPRARVARQVPTAARAAVAEPEPEPEPEAETEPEVLPSNPF